MGKRKCAKVLAGAKPPSPFLMMVLAKAKKAREGPPPRFPMAFYSREGGGILEVLLRRADYYGEHVGEGCGVTLLREHGTRKVVGFWVHGLDEAPRWLRRLHGPASAH